MDLEEKDCCRRGSTGVVPCPLDGRDEKPVRRSAQRRVVRSRASIPLLPLIAWLCLPFLPQTGWPAGDCQISAGEMVSVQGAVDIRRATAVGWQRVRLGKSICAGDSVRVDRNARAAILLANETLLRLDQQTTVTFPEIEADKPSWLDLLQGALHFISRTPKALTIRTPFVSAGVEGTEFAMRVGADRAELWVFEGRVAFSNEKGKLSLGPAEAAVAEAGQAPRRRIVVRPRDAVQWALYYPPVSDHHRAAQGAAAPAIEESLTAYETGDLAAALARLEQVPAKHRDAAYHSFRGALLLSVGRQDKAVMDLDRALAIEPNNGTALAWQSLIAVVRNDNERALALASRAAAADPQSPIPQTALSYAYQASFDLENALESAKQATRLDSQDALAWARLAELHLSLGELDRALEAAQEAVARNPRVARTQSVLGFAYLTRIETEKARAAFENAIELDQADPLPHLGLGLALIKKNDLAAGRTQIEIAASLDPNNSLIRSYLGKAYYEEKRNPLDGRQFDLAKQLDPNDPTPWLYDGIRKQTLNRPAEALDDFNQSKELNDNRAVFRSRFELDEDLATRSTSLARTYRDLGFDERGFLEGWQSLEVDPGNFSAHRFLADTYAGMPRHEIARQSELLQSQLRQPLVIHPIQTQIGELGTFIQRDTGPRDPSFNEHTPLFVRDRPALQVNGIVGGNSTWGDEILSSAITGKASFSVGQSHYETYGHRPNADQKQDSLVAFAQLAVTPSTNVQVEARRIEIERGDLYVRIDPENFDPDLRQTIDEDIFRVGFRHEFSPRSDIIGSYWHQNTDDIIDFDLANRFAASIEGDQAELQHLYRFRSFHLRTGGSYYEGKRRDADVDEGEPITSFEDQTDASLYTYATIRRPGNLNLTLGLSAQSAQGGIVDSDQWNPKFGLVWNAGERRQTTLRLAAFRTLERSITADQTLEPTTIAGFNQFFFDGEGTDAWRYGLGLDHKFNERWLGGLEYSQRDLTVRADFLTEVVESDWKERLGRAYLYWLPHKWWSFSGVLYREEFQRDEGFTGVEEILDLTTDRVALGANFFHPSGLRANLIASYINQDGKFGFVPPFVDDGDSFWVVDLAIGYRLPRRHGLVTLGVKNLLGEEFRFQDTDLENPQFVSERFAFAKVALSF